MKLVDIDQTHSILEYNEAELENALKVLDSISPFMDNYQFLPQYRAGIIDGKKYFYEIRGSKVYIPKGLSEGISSKFQIPYSKIVDNTKFTKEELQKHINTLNLPFQPYEYQFDGVLEMLNDKRMVSIFATGSGKSLIAYIFLTFLVSKNLRTILLVPNVGLVEQMYNDFKDYGMVDDSFICKIYSGQERLLERKLLITTYQSMIKLISNPFIKNIDAIFVDEAHGLNDIENSIGKIVGATENAKWKIGVTGTLPETETGRLSIYSFLGSLKIKVRPIDLIKMGRATPVKVKMIYFNYNKLKANRIVKTMKAKKPYAREIQFLESYVPRNDRIMDVTRIVTEKYGNSIVLFSSISHGELLVKLAMKKKVPELRDIPIDEIDFKVKVTSRTKSEKRYIIYQTLKETKTFNSLNNSFCISNFDIYFIKGEVSGVERVEISNILEEKTNAQLIANFATTSTGTSIKNIHNIIFAITTKGFIRVSQSLGRGMRLHSSKEAVNIIDFVDDLNGKNYALDHSYKRLHNVYFFNGYPVEESETEVPL
jgi:superfamily II DNA or RNA helicase